MTLSPIRVNYPMSHRALLRGAWLHMVGRVTICGFFLLALPVATGRVAFAHGGGTPQLSDVEAGPYRLFVWTQPEPWRVGEVHVTIAVTLPTAEHTDDDEHEHPAQPAEGIEVILHFHNPADPVGFTLQALPHASLGAGYYETDTVVGEEGEWRVEVDLSGVEGSGSAEFAIDVLPTRTYVWLWALAAFMVAIAVLLWRIRSPHSTESDGRVMVNVSNSEDDRA